MTASGRVIGNRYRLVGTIAVGGMGQVWEAWDELLLRPVAVKQLLIQPGLDAADVTLARHRVIREARITARLHHPNAVTLFDVVDQDGHPCLIMQFVRSISLSSLLHEQGTLPISVVSRIGADVAAALVAAHAVGIVHRDVKPGNVLITDDGSAKLTDFGISHAVGDITLTATGMVSGTPAYLAPEVARGAESGYPADVFSLGSTLYAALEGTPPFGLDGNPMAILHRVGSGRIDPPRRSGALTPLLLGMLAPEPADRPTMVDVASALTGRPVEVRTRQDVPPTAVISAQTIREMGADPKDAELQAPMEPADSAPLVLAADSAGRHRPAVQLPVQGRHRTVGPVLVVIAVVLAAVTVIGLLLLRADESPPGGAAAPTETLQSGDQSEATPPTTVEMSPTEESLADSSAPPSLGPSATIPASNPVSVEVSAQPPSTVPDQAHAPLPPTEPPLATTGPSPPTAADLTSAVTDYYALMPGGTDEGWARLTPAFQTEIARNRQSYEFFWNGIDRVVASNVSGAPPDRAEATISYYFTDGRVAVERTAYRLVRDGGILKLDSSGVLSSRSG